MTPALRIDQSPTGAGRGVFAARAFATGETIERCPVLIVEGEDADALHAGLEGYVFNWGEDATAIALGYGSLYNHSFTPNATTLETPDELVITALAPIAEGEEIFINYTGTGSDGVWFEDLSA